MKGRDKIHRRSVDRLLAPGTIQIHLGPATAHPPIGVDGTPLPCEGTHEIRPKVFKRHQVSRRSSGISTAGGRGPQPLNQGATPWYASEFPDCALNTRRIDPPWLVNRNARNQVRRAVASILPGICSLVTINPASPIPATYDRLRQSTNHQGRGLYIDH
jgi:hypothetical protein